jgi:hypothetical protein
MQNGRFHLFSEQQKWVRPIHPLLSILERPVRLASDRFRLLRFSHGHVVPEKVVQSEVLHLFSISDLARDHSRFRACHRTGLCVEVAI